MSSSAADVFDSLGGARGRPTSGALLALVLLTLAAFGLRLSGLDFGLPSSLEDDPKIPVQVEYLRSNAPERNSEREFQWYPLFPARLVTLLPAPAPAEPEAAPAEHLTAAAAPIVQVRMLAALFGALLVPATFALARRFLSAWWSVAAAALAATSLLDQSFSQQARPHAVAGTLMLLAVLACLRLRRRNDWGSVLLAGLALMVALGTLQSAVLLLPAALAALALREREDPREPRWWTGKLPVLLALAALALPIFYPFAFADGGESGESGVLQLSGHKLYLSQFNGKGLGILLRTLSTYDPLLLVLTPIGLVAWIFARGGAGLYPDRRGRARPADLVVVLAFVLPYLLVTAAYSRTYERFVIPLIPFLACFSAWTLQRLSGALAPRASAAVALLALAFPVFASVRLAQVRAAPHTTERAAEWLTANVDPASVGSGQILLTPRLDLPLFREPEGLRFWGARTDSIRFAFLPWARYQASHELRPAGPLWPLRWMPVDQLARMVEEPEAFLADQDARYAVIEVFDDNRVHPAMTRLRQGLQQMGELQARFSPDAGDGPDEGYSEHPFGYQDETSVPPPSFLLRLLQARGTGPVIEVWRLP